MDLQTIIPVVYAQLGLLLLASLVYRRIADLRVAVTAAQSGRNAFAAGFEKAVADLERRLAASEQELDKRRAKRAVRHVSGLKRRRALERLQSGESTAAVARDLDLRPPEAEFLARLARTGSAAPLQAISSAA